MTEAIDHKWIAARLTGRRGEKAALARALGIDSQKLSKVLKGKRQVQSWEIPALLEFFNAEWTPSGFSEKLRPFEANSDTISAINRILQTPAKHPQTYIVNSPAAEFALLTGDLVVIDMGRRPQPGELVAATEHDEDRKASHTFLARWLDPWLALGDQHGAALEMTDNQTLAIYGPVVGTIRGAHT